MVVQLWPQKKNCHLQQYTITNIFVLQILNIIFNFHRNLRVYFFIPITRNSLATSRNQNSNSDSTKYDIDTFPFSNFSDDNCDVTAT